MQCIIAVDFTTSNGDPRSPHSLHRVDPSVPNMYEQALRSVGEIIQDYDRFACCDLCNITPCLKKTVQNCFCQNFVKFTPILITFSKKMAKRLKLCEVHSFLTSSNSRYHTTVLNADVPKCYRTLKVVICNKLSNNLINRIISLYNSLVQNYQNYARSVPHVHGHERLDDDATENVKPHLQVKCVATMKLHLWLHGNMSLYRG